MADNQFDHLRLNEIQVKGSHNSYKQAINPLLYCMLSKRDFVSMSKIDYDHIPLSQQLELGLRNLEIDVYADPADGKHARPLGLQMAKGQPAFDPDHLVQPGFKVFHIPEIDFKQLPQLQVMSGRNEGMVRVSRRPLPCIYYHECKG